MNEFPLLNRIAFLGDYVPRRCGIATFTHDLSEAVAAAAPTADCYVAAVNDRKEGYRYPNRVRLELEESELDSYRRAADFMNFNNADVLCVQHEFGIYGGVEGSHLLNLLKEVRMPVVTTLHTILENPNPVQSRVMKEISERSNRLVVMARKGADILQATYGVPRSKIDIIAHGIPDLPFVESSHYKAAFGVEGRQVLLTFGLIGPDKGIHYVIEALPEIIKRYPNVVYIILGATHPNLLEHEGERYRLGLERLAEECGVKEHVIFHNRYVTLEDLKDFIGATDIYVTPYLNEAQITSGTLAYVFGSGKAVVSTPYWHARELLADGKGVLVPIKNASAIAHGVCELLDDPERLKTIQKNAYAIGRNMTWPSVATRYLESFRHARSEHPPAPRAAVAGWTLNNRPYALPRLRLDHIVRMSDSTGIFQHAFFNVPNFHEGYCVDDNARAYILCNRLIETSDISSREPLVTLASRYLSFCAAALDYDRGRFRNFMSHGRQWLENEGSEDSHGRALWAMGCAVGRSLDQGHRKLAGQLFECALPIVESFTSPRAWAFTLIGIHEYFRGNSIPESIIRMREILTGKLVALWKNCATEDWPWFESGVTYENARLSQALILSGQWMPSKDALDIGLNSLRWLISIQKSSSGCFRPIGNNGFYLRGGARADFDQQPVEVQAMVSACHEAFRATQDSMWTAEAKCAFEWFLGRNELGLPLYDYNTGGCSDGLHCDRVNENQGAESTLAFHLALAEMNFAEHPVIEHPPLTGINTL